MKEPNKSIITGKGRKAWISYFESLTNDQLITSYLKLVDEKRWDQARFAKTEMNERVISVGNRKV